MNHKSAHDALSQSPIELFANKLAEDYLGNYTAHIDHLDSSQLRNKDFNDSLWGTIALTSIEVAVLDSPLFQRLRFLQQLGAVHWVYPSAVHTRFDHALGALFQTTQLINTINELALAWDEGASAPISKAHAQMLRLSALCANIGHLAFSSVSARVVENLPNLETLRRDFWKNAFQGEQGGDVTIVQIIAFYIIRSPAFFKLISILLDKCQPKFRIDDKKTDPENVILLVEQISLTVVGRRVANEHPSLHEVVQGPFGALKLDYLVRNAKFTGIPSVVDVRRLFQKLAVQKRPSTEIPDYLAGALSIGENESVWLFGVKPNATAVLNELQLAQVLVSTKIERHPKVLAIEQMLESAINSIGDSLPPEQLMRFLFDHSEHVLVAMSQSNLAISLSSNEYFEPRVRHQTAASTLSEIRERKLWVRAFQLNPQPLLRKQTDDPNLDRLRDDLAHIQRSKRLLTRVREEALLVLTAAGNATITEETLEASVGLRSLKPAASETQVGRARIIPTEGNPYLLSDTWHGRGNWSEQYLQGQPNGYIFAESSIANAVYIAAEQVALRDYKTQLPRGSVEASKRDETKLNDYKQTLNPDYWRGRPFQSRPRSPILNKASTRRDIGLVAGTISPVSDVSDRSIGALKPEARIDAWLKQFGSDDYIGCALTLLKNLKVISREDTKRALEDFLRRNETFRDAYIVPFGDVKDGSALQAYFANDVRQYPNIVTGSLESYLSSSTSRPLVFIDDFVGTGSQAADIMAAWFGREDLRKQHLGEQRERLSKDSCEKLKNATIAFVFVAAWDDGLTAVRDVAAQLGLRAIASCYIHESQLPFAEAVLRDSGVKAQKIRAFLDQCTKIGCELVRSESGKTRIVPLPEQKVAQRALGYGNKGMLLATLVNAPTQTLTAIWMAGTVDGATWTPLIHRRTKN